MPSSVLEALLFLVNTVLSFFCVLFLLRFMMQWRRVSFAGQLGGFVLKLTNWAIKPLRRVIPGLGGLDWASLVAVLLLQSVYVGLFFVLRNVSALDPFNLALLLSILALKELLRLIVYFIMGIVALEALLSWFNPYSPIAQPVSQLAYPILRPVRRLIPPISGIDLSPMIVFMLLQMVLFLL
jgi:YggT family protein